MARPVKRKVESGRVTPRGGDRPRAASDRGRPEPSARYTPPVPISQKMSPRWVPVLMFGLLAIGTLVILLNYVELMPGGRDNMWLLVGLGAILGGIITATQYH